MVYFPTFGWFLGHMLVNISYMEHTGICSYANMTMKQKIWGMPIFYAHYMRASIIFNPFLFDPAIPQSQFSRSLSSFWGEKLYIFPFSGVFSDGNGTQNLQQILRNSGIFGLANAGDMIPQGIPNIVYADVYWQSSPLTWLVKTQMTIRQLPFRVTPTNWHSREAFGILICM